MQVNACIAQLSDQANVTLHQAGLSFRWHAAQPKLESHGPGIHAGALREPCVLSVLNHRQPHPRRSRQGFAHDAVFKNGVAVVSHRNGACCFKRSIIVQRLPF